MAQGTHNGGDKEEERREVLELDQRTYYLRGKTNISHRHRPTIQCPAVVSSHLSVIERVLFGDIKSKVCNWTGQTARSVRIWSSDFGLYSTKIDFEVGDVSIGIRNCGQASKCIVCRKLLGKLG